MGKTKSARAVALEVLQRIEKGGAYANLLLPRTLAKSGLDARERALATELVYGTARSLGTLDWALSERSNIPLDKLDPPVRALLRLGAYQLLFTRIPPA
ncbi:MAG: transcription antitermination factor NusB, partial [Desulfofundulus sp.]